jgi:hypothetical protein
MSAQLRLSPNLKKLLTYAIAVASFAISLAPTAKAITWTITVTTVGKDQLSYSVDPKFGGCPFTDPQDATYLHICLGDTVQWQARTTGADTTKMFNKLLILHEDFILGDKDDDPSLAFQAVNTKLTEGGHTDKDAVLYREHKYHVYVYDRVTKIKYHDDPKIIIGGAKLEDLFDDVQRFCAQFPKAIDQDMNIDDEAKKQAKKQANEGCQQFQNLKKPLK